MQSIENDTHTHVHMHARTHAHTHTHTHRHTYNNSVNTWICITLEVCPIRYWNVLHTLVVFTPTWTLGPNTGVYRVSRKVLKCKDCNCEYLDKPTDSFITKSVTESVNHSLNQFGNELNYCVLKWFCCGFVWNYIKHRLTPLWQY